MTSLPQALVVGPRKSGTSWIQEYLSARGDVALPNGVKETFFFDRYFAKGAGWYAKHFTPTDNQPCIEVAPTYLEDPATIARIKDTLGDIQIVITLRDPASRTFSLYQHLNRYGQTRAPFREAVETLSLIEGSLYAKQLALWQGTFGAPNVHVLFMSDLARDPQAFADQLCDALCLPKAKVPEALMGKFYEGTSSPNYLVAKVTNTVAQLLRSLRLYSVVNWLKNTGLKDKIFGAPDPNAVKPTLSADDRAWLLDTWLYEDIERLETMLGTSLPDWKT